MGMYFRVAELAKLYGLNSDTLRYYEEQGLLSPKRSENGYREYSVTDLCTINIIRSMRELGVGIKTIKGYLTARTVENTINMLDRQQEIILGKMDELRAELAAVEHKRGRLKRAVSEPVDTVRRFEMRERPCVMLREDGIPEPEVDYLLKRLERKHGGTLKRLGRRWMGAIVSREALEDGRCDRYCAVFFLCESDTEADECLPAGEYISVVHAGPYSALYNSYRLLYEYADSHELECLDTPIELYLADVHDTGDESEYRTELQMRVKAVEQS